VVSGLPEQQQDTWEQLRTWVMLCIPGSFLSSLMWQRVTLMVVSVMYHQL
jgi:hypothetical protein